MEQKIQALEDIFSELNQDKYYQVLFTYCSVERINSHINEIFVGNINYLRNNFDLINMDLSLINAAMTGICLKEGDLSSDEIVNLAAEFIAQHPVVATMFFRSMIDNIELWQSCNLSINMQNKNKPPSLNNN